MRMILARGINGIFCAVLKVSLVLPYRQRLRVFSFVFSSLIGPILGYQKRSQQNLEFIFPHMGADQRRAIAREVNKNFGKNIIENYSKDDVLKALEAAQITGDGLALVKAALADKKPLLLVSGHFGNYETARLALKQMGYESAGLYRPARNPYFNAHYVKYLEYLSGPVFPQDRSGVLQFARYLQAGGVAAMLFDVRATRYDAIPFLGQPAHTSDFPAALALKTGAIVVPFFAHRAEDGVTHCLEFEAPIALTTPREMMAELSTRLESQILKHPEQWFWVHNRWGDAEQRQDLLKKGTL